MKRSLALLSYGLGGLLLVSLLTGAGCEARRRADRPRMALQGFYDLPVDSVAIAPVRNNTGGLLFIPNPNRAAAQPGLEFSNLTPQSKGNTPYTAVDVDDRRSVTYLFREMSNLFIAQKGYAVIANDSMDDRIQLAGASHLVSELDMLKASTTQAVLFITINDWNIADITDNRVITMNVELELRRAADNTTIWYHNSGRRAIQVSDSLQQGQHEFYIETFLNEQFEDFPARRMPK